jgi:hypothetical protein
VTTALKHCYHPALSLHVRVPARPQAVDAGRSPNYRSVRARLTTIYGEERVRERRDRITNAIARWSVTRYHRVQGGLRTRFNGTDETRDSHASQFVP